MGVVEPGRGSDGTCLKQQREAGREAVMPHRTGGGQADVTAGILVNPQTDGSAQNRSVCRQCRLVRCARVYLTAYVYTDKLSVGICLRVHSTYCHTFTGGRNYLRVHPTYCHTFTG